MCLMKFSRFFMFVLCSVCLVSCILVLVSGRLVIYSVW